MADREGTANNPIRVGGYWRISNVGWPGGIAVLEYAIEVAGAKGQGGLEILQTMLTNAPAPSTGGETPPAWLPESGVPIWEGAVGKTTTGQNVRVPAGSAPPIVDPISKLMRSKLFIWSPPPKTDITDNSERFGTGRAMIFFNISKIFGKLNAKKKPKEKKIDEFSFSIKTMDPHLTPGDTTIFTLYDPSFPFIGATVDDNRAHPYTTGDPFSPFPPHDPRSVMFIPCSFDTLAAAEKYANVLFQFSQPTQHLAIQDESFPFTTLNDIRWRARLTTYKRQKEKNKARDSNSFPIGSGPIDTLLNELLEPAPAWEVNPDTDRVGDATDHENSASTLTRPETACTLTFKIKKIVEGSGKDATVIFKPSVTRDPDRRPPQTP